MRAVVFYGPGDLRYEEAPAPVLERGGAVLQVEAALTCGTDVKTLRRGHPVMIPRVPTVFGHEFAGTVVAVDREVKGLREGDRVVAANSAPCGECHHCRTGRPNLCEDLLFVNGAYGEQISLPRRLVERNVVRLAPGTPAARGAFAEPLACALLGVERGRVEAGQTVAVFGHGPLGCLLAMLAAARKARVLLLGKAGWRLDYIQQLGFAETLDGQQTTDVAGMVRALTNGRGADVAIDATGRPEVWEQGIASVGKGGTVVFFGGCAPGTSIQIDTRRAHYDELTFVGAFHHTPELIRRSVELLEAEMIRPDRLVTHRMGLADVRTALDLMAAGHALKILIEP